MNNIVKLQYLSNSGFILTNEEGKKFIIDPYLTNNPRAPFGPEEIPISAQIWKDLQKLSEDYKEPLNINQ